MFAQVRRAETKFIQQFAAEYQADLWSWGGFSCDARPVLWIGLIPASLQTMVVQAETGEVLTAYDLQETGVDLTEMAAVEKALQSRAENRFPPTEGFSDEAGRRE